MTEQNIEKEFHVSSYIIVYKLITGCIELFLGLSLFFFREKLIDYYQQYKTKELLEDPHDLLVATFEKILPFIITHRDYIILFLCALGVIKIIGAVGMYKKKHWGLDLVIGLTILLLPFDIFGFFGHPTFLKFMYVLINIFITLYLVNFKPRDYIKKLHKRIRKKELV